MGAKLIAPLVQTDLPDAHLRATTRTTNCSAGAMRSGAEHTAACAASALGGAGRPLTVELQRCGRPPLMTQALGAWSRVDACHRASAAPAPSPGTRAVPCLACGSPDPRADLASQRVLMQTRRPLHDGASHARHRLRGGRQRSRVAHPAAHFRLLRGLLVGTAAPTRARRQSLRAPPGKRTPAPCAAGS